MMMKINEVKKSNKRSGLCQMPNLVRTLGKLRLKSVLGLGKINNLKLYDAFFSFLDSKEISLR